MSRKASSSHFPDKVRSKPTPRISARVKLYFSVFATFFFLSLIITGIVLMLGDIKSTLNRLL